MDDLHEWIALAQLPCLTNFQKNTLLERFHQPGRILELDRADIFGRGPSGQLRKRVDQHALDRALEWQESEPGHHLLSIGSSLYPPLLKQISDPPLVLFTSGNPGLAASQQIAIVGSRKSTLAGVQTAKEFACGLTLAGLAVTSGMALGIDAAAHHGALTAYGKTIAVLGTGIDKCYPLTNAKLYGQIAQRGLLISEFPLGTEPKKQHFPQRNRIISGLSLGVLVVEAAERSGSLITAGLAARQNREVFAIPGSIHAPASSGCLSLIQQGAKLTRSIRDVLEEFSQLSVSRQNNTRTRTDNRKDPESSRDRGILSLLSDSPTSFDKLIAHSGLTIDLLCSILLDLELAGKVEKLPGNQYIRTAG